ncbi:galactokinase [Enterococcus saccharolyticus]|uniref:galactokinase n=1 Tax=Enterococcus saccharolyticus TaxID=41997 RepID=UPI001E4F6CA9|nr:galactokinase [Enterococcus saccharolyticus]MCD5001087.1 galactokinase [Enterococcus saccharolyticus]
MENLEQIFEERFGTMPTGEYFAPGRINLIGEHTDYNGGNVFPAAITLGTYGVAAKREDDVVQVYSANFPEKGVISFSLAELTYDKKDDWANYPKGMMRYLIEAGYEISTGLSIVFYGNIPNGAGLSSSASIELLTGVILEDLYKLKLNRLDLVKIGKKVENEFIGVNSGIMDQFAVGMGKKDQALLLDTNTLAYEVVPASFGEYVIAIMNTNKRRELADSKYNERRSECEEALRRLQTKLAINTLGDLDEATFYANSSLIDEEVLIKRAKHAVTENQRTLKAKAALESGDLPLFGQLLNASHQSLKEDYEVTGQELDTLVTAAQQHPSTLGARMTGAGFGGCAIALVRKEGWEDFVKEVSATYLEKIGYATDIYQASIDDGARKL